MAPTIKKIAIFGATGTTGIPTVAAAVNKGYEVTVLVRDASKLPADVTPANVLVGDVLDEEAVRKAVAGQDGVIIILGSGRDLSATTLISEGTRNVVNATRAAGVKRVVATLSSFQFWDQSKIPDRVRNVVDDHERALQLLKASDRDWVAVCPPHIDDGPARGDYIIKLEDRVGPMISKYDLAEILVNSLTEDGWVGKRVGLGYAAV